MPQNVVKEFMKILLRMEGAVNGKPFVVNGIGDGKPNQ